MKTSKRDLEKSCATAEFVAKLRRLAGVLEAGRPISNRRGLENYERVESVLRPQIGNPRYSRLEVRAKALCPSPISNPPRPANA
jgi:hypothetical protein